VEFQWVRSDRETSWFVFGSGVRTEGLLVRLAELSSGDDDFSAVALFFECTRDGARFCVHIGREHRFRLFLVQERENLFLIFQDQIQAGLVLLDRFLVLDDRLLIA
jgi:hypothetical protein